MNATSHAKLLDRKEKDRRRSLQWCFSDRADESRGLCVSNISGKREVGVKLQEQTGGRPDKNKNKGDGLPGFLTMDLFTGGLLSLAFHGVNIPAVAQAADEIWLDRRRPAREPHPEASYFIY